MYMKAIYRLEREGPGVTTSALATELGVAPASVSGMLKKLVTDGYVEHEVRGDIKLTRKGWRSPSVWYGATGWRSVCLPTF
jgi:DtxR family Mn-dependent transcriptional regulator